jgi:hypothetical protein
LSREPAFPGEADEPIGSDDHVIQQPNSENLPRLGEAAGNLVILATRERIAARVIV